MLNSQQQLAAKSLVILWFQQSRIVWKSRQSFDQPEHNLSAKMLTSTELTPFLLFLNELLKDKKYYKLPCCNEEREGFLRKNRRAAGKLSKNINR